MLTHRGETEAVVDTETFEVTYPDATGATGESGGGGGDAGVWLLAAGVAGLAAVAGALALRRRRAAPAG